MARVHCAGRSTGDGVLPTGHPRALEDGRECALPWALSSFYAVVGLPQWTAQLALALTAFGVPLIDEWLPPVAPRE